MLKKNFHSQSNLDVLFFFFKIELSDDKQFYCDIVFSNNYFYALTQDGFIEAWNICGQIS
ncbi:hypothetical protein Ahy_B06g080984 [Arachis hypogaea]|uniref:Uncharacterized protein n=1 Tax=Arachis hypogaea TaxID=3818 RepID=A0A444YJT5_ARAHY|nr:hypothetical protein Ahy_B06g080984 [Arachis hypogaea]